MTMIVPDFSHLDIMLPIIREHLAMLWRSCESPTSLYARGSAVTPISKLDHRPWDIDFLLFLPKTDPSVSRVVSEVIRIIELEELTIPSVDIRIVVDKYPCPSTLLAMLLIANDGQRIFGSELARPVSHFSAYGRSICLYAARENAVRLGKFERCFCISERQQRSPHLAKAVLRMGGLLNICEGRFTRSPNECALLISKACPRIERSVSLLLEAVGGNCDSAELIMASHSVLGAFSQELIDAAYPD